MSLDPREAVRRFPPRPRSARAARRFVRAVLEGAEPEVIDAAELLTGELVTNAVLHARTEVDVRVRAADGAVRVRVGDRRPVRPVVSRQGHLYAATGWGLGLVERLAARHGVEVAEDHKAVWFELRPDAAPPGTSSWPRVPAPGPPGTVILVDLPYALYSAARQHRHALLRELVLADLEGAALGLPTADLLTAHDANNLISACVAAASGEQQTDQDIPTLTLAVPADAVEGMAVLRRVLDLAEE
ncbi:ATP-binding protein, partial [Streptomyces misionensis]